MVPFPDDIYEPSTEEGREEVVEASCVEVIDGLGKVVEATCAEAVGSRMEV